MTGKPLRKIYFYVQANALEDFAIGNWNKLEHLRHAKNWLYLIIYNQTRLGSGYRIDLKNYIQLSTTVATNALLERNGHGHTLLITKGFKDLLIGNQFRPKIFDLNIRRPKPLYDSAFEIDESWSGVRRPQDKQKLQEKVGGVSGEAVRVMKKPDLEAVNQPFQTLYDQGCRSLAIVPAHCYTYPEHENLMVPRGVSSTADAYLTPILRGNVNISMRFFGGFNRVFFSRLDVGGTSAERSRYAGRYEVVYETTTAGVSIQSPQMDINTVATGGGSCLTFVNGIFRAGPESAELSLDPLVIALTDVDLLLGRLIPDFFPKIFGKSEKELLDEGKLSKRLLGGLMRSMRNPEKHLEGRTVMVIFIKVANETMAGPIRALTEARGYATSKHVMILIPRYSSILSVWAALADQAFKLQEPPASLFYNEKMLRGFGVDELGEAGSSSIDADARSKRRVPESLQRRTESVATDLKFTGNSVPQLRSALVLPVLRPVKPASRVFPENIAFMLPSTSCLFAIGRSTTLSVSCSPDRNLETT
ncbi:hypothetical protein K435DRAFT_807676 [Dendrothele bispora CBS 962.96]|uniref:Uncharacterized protein n=1 Tax=Dendrothele bispora (strain CBS 962.96) TaxID=1314807 RepID=A0A4V4HCH8_DENBC|nr:hypothetical protein K435DRAFT_807676 [Dendrothele bispora CBS 962.96]